MEKIISAFEYSQIRWLCHNVKKKASLDEAAEILAEMIPDESVIIPMPGHTGPAIWSLDLAEKICRIKNTKVLDCLYEMPNIGSHEAKKNGIEIRPKIIRKIGYEYEIPNNAVLIDNVYDTGFTYNAACEAIGRRVKLFTIGKTKYGTEK